MAPHPPAAAPKAPGPSSPEKGARSGAPLPEPPLRPALVRVPATGSVPPVVQLVGSQLPAASALLTGFDPEALLSSALPRAARGAEREPGAADGSGDDAASHARGANLDGSIDP
jgi:hypothetical protein